MNVHAHTHTCMRSQKYTYTQAHMHTRTHVTIYTCTHTHTRTHTHKRTYTKAHIHTRTHAHKRTYTQAHIHTRTHAHTHPLMSTRMKALAGRMKLRWFEARVSALSSFELQWCACSLNLNTRLPFHFSFFILPNYSSLLTKPIRPHQALASDTCLDDSQIRIIFLFIQKNFTKHEKKPSACLLAMILKESCSTVGGRPVVERKKWNVA